MNPLRHRLVALRRHLRVVVTLRGGCWIVALLLLAAALGGLADWRFHLPALVRAFLLTSTLVAAGYVGQRYLVQPLLAKTDDLSLALRLERHYPVLNDSLASAFQFLEQQEDVASGASPSLRGEAVRRALEVAKLLDFHVVVDRRGSRLAGFSAMVAGTLVLGLCLAQSQLAWTGLVRLANPFGLHDWPRQTIVEIEARSRAARGAAFEIRATFRGAVPVRAAIEYRFPGTSPVEHLYEITRTEGAPEGLVVARLEPGHVQRNFRFQVRANDAVSDWREVEVLSPPQLVPLAGRPSPQIHVSYPAYTDLAPQELPDGATSIEVIAGTQVALRAAVNRPLARAWLESPGELRSITMVAACLAPLNSQGLAGTNLLAVAQASTWKQIPARLEADGGVLALDFVARVNGTFTLHFEDELGLGNTRLVDLRTVLDPAPTVSLERPARSQDSLDLLPDADVSLKVRAEDPIYAVRSIYLEYRRRRGESAETPEESGKILLYDHAALGGVLPQLLPVQGAVWALIPIPAVPVRLPRVDCGRGWSLKDLQLQEGDMVTIQACADDFDDVTIGKKAGRSHELELRIVGHAALDLTINEAQGLIQQELTRLHQQVQDALKKVIPAEAEARNQRGRLLPQQLEQLIQAEQLQQQIRTRVGTKEEGLRADAARILQTLRANHLPRSAAHDRMEAIAAELDRLAREELEQIEPRLTEARKESETGMGQRSPEEPGPLTEARKHQEEVKKTLAELLKLLEPWSSTREARGEAKVILQEQRKLAQETTKLGKEIPVGAKPQDLTEAQRAELERASELQNKLAERTAELLDKLESLGQARSELALQEAAQRGRQNDTLGKMQEAARSLQQNNLAKAGGLQQAGSQALAEVVKTLEERREEELERLIEKITETERHLAELTDRQEMLRKKAREADQSADPQKRAQELMSLAREQEHLEEEVQELVRELSRLRTERAAQALGRAVGQMRQARQQLEKGQDPQEQQEETLDRLDETRRELRQERQDKEEELTQEKLTKIADQIKGIRERQEALTTESARIHNEVLQKKEWTRALRASLLRMCDAQKGLGEETDQIAQEKLKQARVFEHLLTKSANAMRQASDKMQDLPQQDGSVDFNAKQAPLDLVALHTASQEVQSFQRAASRRLELLLEALKPEPGVPMRPSQPNDGGQSGKGNQPMNSQGNDLPPVAELKALRALQQELNDRTKNFVTQHPDPFRVTRRQFEELQVIHQDQQEMANLFDRLIAGSQKEGDNR